MAPATRRIVLGAAVAAVVVLLLVWDVGRDGVGAESWPRAVLGWVLIAVGCGALWWRRRRPVAVALVTLVCSALYFPFADRDVPLLVAAFAVALFTVAAQGHLVAAVTLAVVTMLAIVLSEVLAEPGQRHVDDTSIFLLAGWFVGLVAAGTAYSTRLAYLREAEQRALAAEREKDVRARQSAAEERLRIARELHDVLGHNISLINVQSAAALHRYAKHGDAAAQDMVPALETVRDTSREALRELRATLGVLRQVDDAVAPTSPAGAGLAGIAELAERTGGAGLRVRAELPGEGAAEGLPPEVGLAAYRIVQESLTNVVRHARAATAEVRVRREGDALLVTVVDDGGGAPPGEEGGAEGSGLGGMAERARALGGELTTGNVTDDAGTVRGFRVAARLPVRGTLARGPAGRGDREGRPGREEST
ncbi:histidine kinase [Streptomyces sp. DSM 42041]|uniref:histidine kinase n=1 Tax=Streptomyces hazeniae TaxID=3075538 RepID=A0ABU2NNP2_9ACTN|nr:histidine kinase [Streptomyces sp. DSM 42041]MDT0378594.1 histidine kinase [Streptomyces sp. DSM 42041]